MKKLLEQEARKELFLLLDHYLIARQNGEYSMSHPQQQQQIIKNKKDIVDQAKEIKEQEKLIAEMIKQQQDPRHNQW